MRSITIPSARARFIEDWETIDAWAPLASPLRRFRRKVRGFPEPRSVLDSGRGQGRPLARNVEERTGGQDGRHRVEEPGQGHQPLPSFFTVRGMGADAAHARRELRQPAIRRQRRRSRLRKAKFGVDLWTPPGIDLKNDLDDLAALTSALDLVIGPANATTQHRRRGGRANLVDLNARRVAETRHRPLSLVSAGQGVQSAGLQRLGAGHGRACGSALGLRGCEQLGRNVSQGRELNPATGDAWSPQAETRPWRPISRHRRPRRRRGVRLKIT